MIEFARPDGQRAPGYYSAPANGSSAPGVVLLEEWWGVTDHIKQMADRFAQAGFRVLVPDLYRGRNATVPDEANHLMQSLDFGDAATQDTRGAVQYLKSTGSSKVAVLGFCMGGALALLAGMYVPELDAVVSFYGFPPPEAGDLGQIKVPVQGHWAQHDDFATPEGVNTIEGRFKEAGVAHEFHRYDAGHGFNNPHEMGHGGLGHYDEDADKLSMERTMAFLHKQLD
ncbi:MAG TPA: dienelactone hydrolase family protein [Candidatus Aquilonibacter sp.]|nr:dienelactone hydrolase family protein [Candidatus Aquilonibacter sp.]